LPEGNNALNPSYYTRLDPEPIQVILGWGLPFSVGCALKYVARAGYKEGNDRLTELGKASTFLGFQLDWWKKRDIEYVRPNFLEPSYLSVVRGWSLPQNLENAVYCIALFAGLDPLDGTKPYPETCIGSARSWIDREIEALSDSGTEALSDSGTEALSDPAILEREIEAKEREIAAIDARLSAIDAAMILLGYCPCGSKMLVDPPHLVGASLWRCRCFKCRSEGYGVTSDAARSAAVDVARKGR